MRTPLAIVVCVSVGLPSLAFGRVVPISSVTASSTETERGGQSFDASYLSSLSKRDLKHSGTFFQKFACDLGFAAYQIFCPKGPCGTTF